MKACDKTEWRAHLNLHVGAARSTWTLGLLLMWAVLNHEGPLVALGRFHQPPSGEGHRFYDLPPLGKWRQRDILPLQLPDLSDVLSARDKYSKTELPLHLKRELTVALWLWLVILALNSEFSCQRINKMCAAYTTASKAQMEALRGLTDDVRRFVDKADKEIEVRNFVEELGSSSSGDGTMYEETDDAGVAVPTVFKEVLPGLPRPEVAASVDVRNVASGEV